MATISSGSIDSEGGEVVLFVLRLDDDDELVLLLRRFLLSCGREGANLWELGWLEGEGGEEERERERERERELERGVGESWEEEEGEFGLGERMSVLILASLKVLKETV